MTERENVVVIIQARMGSTRLPGKVLADIHGCPMLWRVVQRARAAKTVDDVVVATTTEPSDDVIESFCRENKVNCFRGSESDVLDRYYQAARKYHADPVVRITADCPLIDSEVADKTVQAFLENRPDYASNSLLQSFPRGLDTEVVSFRGLEEAWRAATWSYQRAHVTPYLYEHPDRFRILPVTADKDYSGHRWTVDTHEDLQFVRAVFSRLVDTSFSFRDVLKLLESEPALIEINRHVLQKAPHEC